MNGPTTLDAALRAAGRADRARPLVTHYDDHAGYRTELSVASFDNAVAKAANLLVDVLDVQPGDRVALDLPLHWQLPVWLGACWAMGAVATIAACATDGRPEPAGGAEEAAVAVVGADRLDRAAAARDTVAVALDAFGLPLRDPLPPGVLDQAVEARGQADTFVAARPPGPDAPALEIDGTVLRHEDVLDRATDLAARLGLPAGGRLLTAADPVTVDGLLAVLAVPLATGGSVVLVGGADATVLADRVRTERVDAVLAPPVSG